MDFLHMNYCPTSLPVVRIWNHRFPIQCSGIMYVKQRGIGMKNPKKRKLKKRLPLEAVLRLRSYPVTTQKGEKGYNRKKLKEQNGKIAIGDIPEENH